MIKKRLQSPIIVLLACLLFMSVTLAVAFAASVGEVRITFIDAGEFPMIRLYLAVSDIDGRPLVGLRSEEVTLFENEVPIQPVTFEAVEHPMLVGVVIDSSGSFAEKDGGESRLDHAREAARQLVNPVFNRLTVQDEVAVFAFAQGQPVRLLDFTSDHDRAIREGINRVNTEGNNYTTLFDLMRQAIKDIIGREGVRRRALLLFSDGIDETSALTVDQVIQKAVEADLLIYTVGMGPKLAADQQGSAFLRRLANETGGQYLWFQPDQSQGQEAMQRFLEEFPQQRQGYALSFESNEFENTPEVRVVVQNGGRLGQDISRYRVPPQPPEVRLDTLQEGAEVSGMITIQPIIVRQQRPIKRVEYRVDGQLLHTARVAPFSFQWHTEGLVSAEAQAHNLTVTVIDRAGLERQISRNVTVRPMPTKEVEAEPKPESEQDASSPESNGDGDTTSSSLRGLYMALGIGLLLFVLGIAGVMIWQRRQNQDQTQDQDLTQQHQAQDGKQTHQDQDQNQDQDHQSGVDLPQADIPTIFFSGSKRTLAALVVANGAQKGKQFPISKSTVFLGRDKLQADLVFDWDRRISRRHAKISRKGNLFYIWDLESANGTRVNQSDVLPSNGNHLSDALPIDDQATIQLGPELELIFYANSGPAKKKPHYHPPTQPIGVDVF